MNMINRNTWQAYYYHFHLIHLENLMPYYNLRSDNNMEVAKSQLVEFVLQEI